VDTIADTSAPPAFLYANEAMVEEMGTQSENGALYVPGPGQPGFDPVFLPSYHFISDVPEPATFELLALVASVVSLKTVFARISRS